MDAVPEPSRSAPRRPIALAVSGLAVVVLLVLLVATFMIDGDDGDASASGTTVPAAAIPGRSGTPDVDAMLSSTLLTPDGDETTLGDLLGDRPMLVNQWSRTCAPCVEEMPWLDAISKANPQIDVLGVNDLDLLEAAQRMADQTGITYPWVRDPAGDFAHAARTVGLPDTMLFSADGTLLASKVGVFADQAAIQAFVDDNLPKGEAS
ncbi:MAG: TlpA family protein disulfide reductase [Actinobacteria bacterium]|nr:TlpA family protein disulfide reductase [Actinomycetota bacterium]